MSLGLARDSILNLTKLAHDDDDDHNNTDKYMKRSASFTREHIPHDNNMAATGTEDDFFFLDDMEQETKIDTGNIATDAAAAVEDDLFSVESENSKSQNKTTVNDAGAYAGFAYDYGEYGDYYSDPYAPTSSLNITKKNKPNIFCCIFAPWFSPKKEDQDDDHDDDIEEQQSDGKSDQNDTSDESTNPQLQPQTIKKEKDPSATFEEEKKCHQDEPDGDEDTEEGALSDTDAYGEKMTDKDRKAILARLRLSDPSPPPIPSPDDKSSSATPSSILDKVKSPPSVVFRGAGSYAHGVSLDQETKTDAEDPSNSSEPPSLTPKLPKGILKKSTPAPSSNESADRKNNNNKESANNRRALFPKYEARNDTPTPPVHSDREGNVNNVQFSPMARVITIHTHHNMTFAEKSRVWFQRSDYDEFKKTGRIIAKAMLEGGSEIWLTTSNAWGRRTNLQQSKGENVDSDYDRALQKYTNRSAFGGSSPTKQEPGETPTEQQDDFGNKWWCKFGHSRRGLEHIASMEEGQQRQRNVNAAIRAVMDEQRRQRATHSRDARKLATIAYHYTSWARDLAHAAGKADAEAVQTNFKTDAKGRIQHLTENLKNKSTTCSIASNDLATGRWRGIIGASSSGHISSVRLDANTSSTMKYKQQQQKMQQIQTNTKQQKPQNNMSPDVSGGVTEEAIHDPDFSHEQIAKKAAGFGIGEDSKDMSAVLTGMGAAGATAAR